MLRIIIFQAILLYHFLNLSTFKLLGIIQYIKAIIKHKRINILWFDFLSFSSDINPHCFIFAKIRFVEYALYIKFASFFV